jgi:hypothetical protein
MGYSFQRCHNPRDNVARVLRFTQFFLDVGICPLIALRPDPGKQSSLLVTDWLYADCS